MTPKERARVDELMRLLDCTEAEALDVIETDKIIDKGGRTKYDLSKEQEKLAMKISAVTDRKAKSENNMRGKVRAENLTKSGIIASLSDFLTENGNLCCENVKITNKERQIAFSVGENKYELTLVQKRTPKK